MSITNVKADLVLSGNAVFTSLENEPKPASIAIVANRIAAIGTQKEIEPFIGPETKVIHCQDQLIMPGFHDFHLHVMLGSLQEASVNLIEARSEKEAVEMVKDFAESQPGNSWVHGFSWYHAYWDQPQLPNRVSLDQAYPDRPVILLHAACHAAWLNSKGLEMLNITRDTPNPPYGEIERDANGEPTGILFESAIALAKDSFHLSEEKSNQIFKNFLQQAAMFGVTSVNDMLPLPAVELGDLDVYKQFEEDGQLTTRIHFLITLDGDFTRAKRMREQYQSEKLQFSGLKQFLDGIVTGHTAFLVDPYEDKPETTGDTPFPKETIKNWVAAADREGFKVRFHAVGDGAVRLALDLFEDAQKKNGLRDSRHTIEHIEVIHPEDINRFKKLGVIASVQPEHMALVDKHNYLSRIGLKRDQFTFPVKSLIDSGAVLALGTDYPVVSFNPLLEIYRAVSRIGGDQIQWNPKECILLADALKAYTITPAFGTFREREIGTLEVGKLADIIVLDRNLFNIAIEEIQDAKVKITIMDGKIVFEDENILSESIIY